MPILMQMFWEGINPGQYEKLRANVNWEGNQPRGLIFHTSAFDKRGIHVTDIWESHSDFNSFIEDRLMPEVKKIGITDLPQVDTYDVYNTSVPEYHTIFGNVKQTM